MTAPDASPRPARDGQREPQSPVEGRLRIALRPDPDGGMQARIASTRPVHASRLLEGRTRAEVLALVPMLYAVCGRAHGAAATIATASALGQLARPDPALLRAAAAENLREHLLRLYLDWPGLLGEAPDGEALALVNRLCRDAARPGDDAALPPLRRFVEERAFGMPARAVLRFDGGSDFARWSQDAGTLPARFFGWLGQQPPLRPVATPPLLGDLPPHALHARLAADDRLDFVAAPTWDGQCRETGPLARHVDHPLVRSLAAAAGGALAGRFAARLLDVAKAVESFDTDRGGAADAGAAPGLAVVETSRGRLAHHVAFGADERVSRYRVLAPTEWNFHPDGTAARLLSAIPGDRPGDVALLARLAVHAVDPCIGYELQIEAGDA